MSLHISRLPLSLPLSPLRHFPRSRICAAVSVATGRSARSASSLASRVGSSRQQSVNRQLDWAPRIPATTLATTERIVTSTRRSIGCGATPSFHRAMSTTPSSAMPASTSTSASASTPNTTTDSTSLDSNNTSGITASSLSQSILTAPTLQAATAEVEDISGGCGQSFSAVIVSAVFEGKMTLARHRLVNKALAEQVARIHAWTPKCYTPAEWEGKKGGG